LFPAIIQWLVAEEFINSGVTLTGKSNNTPHHPSTHHPAYHAKAPVGPNPANKLNQVMLNIQLQNQVVAVAKLIPIVRIYSGYASAE
jgi:hypothetical protein